MRTTFHSRKRTATIGAALTAVLTLTLALTACNGDNSALGSTQASPTASADKAGGTGGAGKADQSAGAGTGTGTGGSDQSADTSTGDTSEGKVDMCRSGVLDATAADNTTNKTDGVVTVTFKNVAGSDCRISGFPGVDLKTSLGDTFSVDRNGEQAVPQILKEGETAAFNITFPVNNTGGSGVKLTDLVVTPPNEIESFTLTWPAGTLAVTDGEDDGKMEISPVSKVSDSPAG
ncbi:DUF4232 domain-containing protein [Streptomyces globisporus]|uniref:DUF4232 domain-containing protein n=1 Tax=Streptomyces globisporus TaxID=1908 RepID=UPI00068989FA|nr:DUF4232 domain-containing protein [Streptomyces globisporus]